MLLQFMQTYLAEVLIFSLMFSQALFMSSLSLKFSKAANLFEISIWYCFLTCNSFIFPRLNHTPSNSCAPCLLNAKLSLTCNHQIIISITVSSPETSHVCYTRMPSPINMWSFWLWVFPSGEVQVYLWMFLCRNIILFQIYYFMWQSFLF